MRALQSWTSRPWLKAASSWIATYALAVWCVVCGLILWYLRGVEAVIAAGWALFVAFSISFFTGLALGRPRPFAVERGIERRINVPPTDSSLPSLHSTVSFSLATSLAWLDPVLAVPSYVVACVVAFGRVAAGVHYPSDALLGALIGSASAYAVHLLMR